MTHFLFTSESVSIGHPDKIADQISDAVLDACLTGDPYSKVACETLVSQGLIVLSGEITTSAQLDYQEIIRRKIKDIGYNDSALKFDFLSSGIIISINKQSTEIARGMNAAEQLYHELGASDQGIVFGFACDETPELMPLPIMLAHRIVRLLREKRQHQIIPYLRPDAKSQVTVEYDENHCPIRVHTVVVSTQHAEGISQTILKQAMEELIAEAIPAHFIDKNTAIYINPIGPFVDGGPAVDCGLTGRKIIVDTYGGMARHGGGAFSGKDPAKIDRAGGYAARYVAKNIVAAKLAKRCEVQLSYAIGNPFPISVAVNTFGTGIVSEDLLVHAVPSIFQLSPSGIIHMLDLRRPIYQHTAYEGHFGREHPDFTWEKTNRIDALLRAVTP
jgi:S-adenosylmethionine synthetase